MNLSTIPKFAGSLLLGLLGFISLIGCGSSPQPVNETYVQMSTDRSTQAREIFDGAGGDLKKVTPDDHAKLVKLFGSDSEVERIWNNMAHPPGARGPDQGAPR
jgi:hypothetical protein